MNHAPFRFPLLGTTAAAGVGVTSGTSLPLDCSGFTQLVVYYTSFGTTSGGTLILEEADYNTLGEQPYSGTWSQLESRAASSFTGSVTLAVHLTPAAYRFIRVRISSAITGGGSVLVVLCGQES